MAVRISHSGWQLDPFDPVTASVIWTVTIPEQHLYLSTHNMRKMKKGNIKTCEKFGDYSFQIPQDSISDQTLEEEIFGDKLHPDDCMTSISHPHPM